MTFLLCKFLTHLSTFYTLLHLHSTTYKSTTQHTHLSIYTNRMLNEMEEDLETATENLSMVTIKTKELIQKSGGKRNFIIIVVLSLVVVVLLFLILYT